MFVVVSFASIFRDGVASGRLGGGLDIGLASIDWFRRKSNFFG